MKKNILINMFAAIIVSFMAATSGYCDAPAQSVADMNCAACHDKQVKSMTNPDMHASVHAKKGIGQCTTCHDTAALKESHKKVKPGETKFVKARRYPQDFCLKCHGTYMDIIKRTSGRKALTDSKGKMVNPHDLPKVPQHGKLTECSVCHKEHKEKTDIVRYCQGCHHTGEFLACNKCHANK